MDVVNTANADSSPADDLAFLNSVMLFRDVPARDLSLILQIMKHETYDAGSLILLEGEATNDLLIVRDGTVLVYVSRDDKQVEITRLGPTSYFGEMSVFDDYPRSANVAAVTDVRVCRIERDTFRNFVVTNPPVLFQMCTVFSHRLRNTNSALTRR